MSYSVGTAVYPAQEQHLMTGDRLEVNRIV